MKKTMNITLEQLENLLIEQKRLVIENLLHHTYYYNKESDEGNLKSLPVDELKFKDIGYQSRFPNDVEILKKYLKE